MKTPLASRLVSYRVAAAANVANQEKMRTRGTGCAQGFLDQWPTDWRAVARKEAEYRRTAANGQPFAGYGSACMRWIERPQSVGLRFVGFADEVCRRNHAYLSGLDHGGWHTHPDHMSELVRGVVYRLTGRNGRARYVAGYADPYNPGAACLDFETIFEGEEVDPVWGGCASYDQGARDAARHGDSIAETMAENEREYQAAFSAGTRFAEHGKPCKPRGMNASPFLASGARCKG